MFVSAGGENVPTYRAVAISEGFAEKVRTSRRAPGYGHPVHAEVATGYGPCRLCLRDFAVGVDRRLLFTLDPFHGVEPFPLPGPVFIHENECDRHPENAGFPTDLLSHGLTVVGYARGPVLRAEERVPGSEIESAIARLLARADVDYLHVRDTAAGCYDLRIERA
ncbi:MAG TPA: DUF1203 domain-containing protein [Thermoanaerobaculia bacterium]